MSELNDFDSPWKEILERYFQEFMSFFFPEAAAEIDGSVAPQFLDKELQKIVRDGELGRRYADKLVQIRLLDGKESWLLIHIEVQGSHDPDFAERMFVYAYRIFDRYRRRVASLAILTDASLKWRPDTFKLSHFGCELGITFPIVKLIDYRGRESELEQNDNPFATVALSHLACLNTSIDDPKRLVYKRRITRRLYQRRYSRQRIIDLFTFIDWAVRLPPALEIQYHQEVDHIEAELQMPYITSIERRSLKRGHQQGFSEGLEQGVKKGLEQGRQQGLSKALERQRQLIRRLLELRFGELPEWVDERLGGADADVLEQWGERLISATTLEKVFY